MKVQFKLIASAAVAALALAACGKKEQPAPPPPPVAAPAAPEPIATPAPAPAPAPISVVGLELGKAVDANQAVTAPTALFAPSDTIYVSVATDGSAGSAVIAAKWTYQDGQTVKEDSITIAPTGPAHTAFSISKPDGWPQGKYTVAVTLDGTPAGSREFEVQ